MARRKRTVSGRGPGRPPKNPTSQAHDPIQAAIALSVLEALKGDSLIDQVELRRWFGARVGGGLQYAVKGAEMPATTEPLNLETSTEEPATAEAEHTQPEPEAVAV